MINKVYPSAQDAVADVFDGAAIIFGGFASAGRPITLARALRDKGARNLTIITNGVHMGDELDTLCEARQVRKVIASFPVRPSPDDVNCLEKLYRAGEVEIEALPQGTFVERMRAGGAGLGGFYSPVGVGTMVAEGKEKRLIDGREYILELPLKADFALIKAHKGDRLGNLVYRGASRNFNPAMATAARVTIAEVEHIVEVGELDPDVIVTPGIYVHRLIQGERYEVQWYK